MSELSLSEKIIEAAIRQFKKDGIRFRLDDIVADIGISKKTIYTVFDDKNDLVIHMADYVFDEIKEEERRIASRSDIGTIEKLRGVLNAFPEKYAQIDFTQFEALRQKYPKVYKEVEKRLESGWDLTIELIEQGIREGSIKNMNITVVKIMYQAALEQFFQKGILKQSGYKYSDALSDITEIILNGITIPKEGD